MKKVILVLGVMFTLGMGSQSYAALGDSGADLVYTPVIPCRIIDTRGGGGPIANGNTRNFLVAGTTGFESQGGNPGGCGIPEDATSVMVNFIAVGVTAAGDLRAWPYGGSMPLASIINFAPVPGLNIANGLIQPICNPGMMTCTFDLTVLAEGSEVHVVADVTGYFGRFPTEQLPGAPTASGTVAALDGSASAGSSAQYSRGDHKHGIASGSITSAHIQDGTIVNADISGSAAIDFTKLSGVASATHNHDATYVNEGQANSITTGMITDGQVTKPKLSATGGTNGQVLGTDGTNLVWQNDSGLTLPYVGLVITNQAAFWVNNWGTQGTGIWGLATDGIGVYGEGNGNPGYGVWGKHTGTGNYGLVGMSGAGVYAYGYSNHQGVHAESQDSTGVHGQSVNGYGVYGESTNGDGIFGLHGGTGNYGQLGSYVAGAIGSGMGNARGVHGQSQNATGVHGQSVNGYGVYGESTNGIAAVFRGNVHILSKGTGAIVLEMGEGLDYAEGFDVSDRTRIVPGTVLVIDPDNPGKLTTSNKPYDIKVAGIVAGAKGLGSGVRLGTGRFDLDVALAGRVYCNVDGAYGEISPGDLLTTSPTPGFAMKVSDHAKSQGAILGKAMEKLEKGERGQILVLVTLQ